MSAEVVISIIAVIVALASAWFSAASVKQAKRSADAADAQVAGQKEANIAAAQPYVWADIRGSDVMGTLLEVVVGNAGVTVAQNVRVTFDPPLPMGRQTEAFTRRALCRLADGLDSLAPGRSLRWVLGTSSELLKSEHPQVHHVTIDADGPFGHVPTLAYDIDLSDFRESADQPQGTLHLLTRAVEGVAKELKKRG